MLYTIYSHFFFNDTATTEIYTLSLHDALPISFRNEAVQRHRKVFLTPISSRNRRHKNFSMRSEEHTSELQSHLNLVCRLLLEKKNHNIRQINTYVTLMMHNERLYSCNFIETLT